MGLIHIPTLFMIVGQPGNNKTAISNAFEKQLMCEVIHTDQLFLNWITDTHPTQKQLASSNIRGFYTKLGPTARREWNEYLTTIIVEHAIRTRYAFVAKGWLLLNLPPDLREKIETFTTTIPVQIQQRSAYVGEKRVSINGSNYTNIILAICEYGARFKGIQLMRSSVKHQCFEDIRDFQGVSDSQGKLLALNLPARLDQQHVLDLGCSTGYFSIRCAKRGAQVIGIDKNRRSVVTAARLAITVYRLLSVAFLADDFFTASLTQQFDYILAVNLIAHIGDKIEFFFQRAFDLLRPGGILVVETAVSAFRSTHPQYKTPYIDVVTKPSGKVCYYANQCALLRFAHAYKLIYKGRSIHTRGPRRRRVYHFQKPMS